MKNFSISFRAIHPPLLLIAVTWAILFYLGYEYPQYIKMLVTVFVVVIVTIVLKVSSKVSENKKILLIFCGSLLIVGMLISNEFSTVMSFLLGIFITWVLFTDSKNRHKEYLKVYREILNIKPKERDCVTQGVTETEVSLVYQRGRKSSFLEKRSLVFKKSKKLL